MSAMVGGGWLVIYRGKLTTTFSQISAETPEAAIREVCDEIITNQAHHGDSAYVIAAEDVHVFNLEGLPSLKEASS